MPTAGPARPNLRACPSPPRSTATSDFSLFCAACPCFGDSIALVTLYLRVAHGGHGWMIAALSVAAALPLVALAPLAGHVVDRLPAKSFLSALCGFEALACVGMGLFHGDGVTIALMALLTCGVAFSMPGYGALVPTLSGEENVAVAQSSVQSVQGVALTAGPALGGLLVGRDGPELAPLRRRDQLRARRGRDDAPGQRPDDLTHPTTRRRNVTSGRGCDSIFTHPLLRPVMVTVTVFMLSLGAVNVAEVFFITRTLHASALFYALVGTSFGLGSVAGSLASRRLPQAAPVLGHGCPARDDRDPSACSSASWAWSSTWATSDPLMVATGVAVGVINVANADPLRHSDPRALTRSRLRRVGRVPLRRGDDVHGARRSLARRGSRRAPSFNSLACSPPPPCW